MRIFDGGASIGSKWVERLMENDGVMGEEKWEGEESC